MDDSMPTSSVVSSTSAPEAAGCPFHPQSESVPEDTQNAIATSEVAAEPGAPAPECTLPRLLQTQLFWHRHNKFITSCHKKYGDTFALRVLPWRKLFVITKPEDIKTVFLGDAEVFHAGEGNRPLAPVLGKNSVIVIDEDEHLRKRKQMLPPFHGQAVKRYEETVQTIVDEEVGKWPYRKSFSLHPRMRKITLEVIIRAVMGVEDVALLQQLREVLPLTVELPAHITLMWIEPRLGKYGPWKRYKENLALANQLLLDEVKKRRLRADLDECEDILSLLIRETEMEDEDLRDQLMTMLLAGHETTTTALSWAMERLIRTPDALRKAKEGDDAYLEAVIKETLRIRPVIPGVLRDLTSNVRFGKYEAPKGVTVFPAAAIVHRDPENYTHPEEFRPERFLEGEGGTYTWIPFGGGRRRCLGAAFATMEMRICLRAILDKTELIPDKQASERERNFHITLVPHRGAKVIRVA